MQNLNMETEYNVNRNVSIICFPPEHVENHKKIESHLFNELNIILKVSINFNYQ